MQKKGDCFALCHSGLNRVAHRIKSVQLIILIAPYRVFELGNHPGTPGSRHLHQTQSLFQFPFVHLSNTHCFSVPVSKSVVQSTISNYQKTLLGAVGAFLTRQHPDLGGRDRKPRCQSLDHHGKHR